MKLFVIFLLILGVIYGGVTTVAAATQLRLKSIAKGTCFFMALGGLLVSSSLILRLIGINTFINIFYILLWGLISIHICAVFNGYKLQGSINLRHHIVRTGISIVLITVFLLS